MPTTSVSLVLLVLGLLPGASYTWAFEREAGAYGVSLSDRTLRFIAASVAFHVVLAWPEYLIWRVAVADHRALDTGQFATLWAAAILLVVLPYAAGRLAGRFSRQVDQAPRSRRLTALLGVATGTERPPRAWDALFLQLGGGYLRILLADGSWVAGAFASNSYAGGFPQAGDLYLEMAWSLDPDTKTLVKPLGYGLYVPADKIVVLDVIPPAKGAP